jgi:amino acid transporter
LAGTGLFVASGKSLASGGPAAVLICFVFVGVTLFCTVQALGEMAVLFPVAGSFSAYSTRFIDPAWGFAMGWVLTIYSVNDIENANTGRIMLCSGWSLSLSRLSRRPSLSTSGTQITNIIMPFS